MWSRRCASRYGFQRDRDYVVVEDKIVIVDESTGRQMEGRKWQDGLHQAVEAKEMVPITAATGQAARITIQTFFRQYEHLAGMTGTAAAARRELATTYSVHVAVVPTNRPCIRTLGPPRIFKTLDAKRHAVADEIVGLHVRGRAVLVGTPSVDASEALGRLLAERIIPHRDLERELPRAGSGHCRGRRPARHVTIATNMAGRGTDILLHDDVPPAADCTSSPPKCTAAAGSIASWSVAPHGRGILAPPSSSSRWRMNCCDA